MPTARLFTAFEWICDECGVNNFASAIEADLSAEEQAELHAALFSDEDRAELAEAGCSLQSMLVGRPTQVTCRHCQRCFEVDEEL